jgi:hypothetical protein
MMDGKSPEQEGPIEPLEKAGRKDKEMKRMPCHNGFVNECDGMMPWNEDSKSFRKGGS